MMRLPPTPTLFPTRRSSDLQRPLVVVDSARRADEDGRAVGGGRILDEHRKTAAAVEQIQIAADTDGIEKHLRAARGERTARARSEEHTSELQSQFHLVCRLL